MALLEQAGYAVVPIAAAKAGVWDDDYDEERLDTERALQKAMNQVAVAAGWETEWNWKDTIDGSSDNTVYLWPKEADR